MRYRLLAPASVFLVFILRFISIQLFPPDYNLHPVDIDGYNIIAENILGGEGYNTAYRGPVYPYYLAFIHKMFGHSVKVDLMLNCILDLLTAVLILLISYLTFRERIIGIVSVSLFAVYYPEWQWLHYYFSEPLYALLLALFVYIFLLSFDGQRQYMFFISGIVLGVTALCRPAITYFPLFFAFCGILFRPLRTVVKKSIFSFVLGTVIVLAFWAGRNWLKYDRIIIGTTVKGYVLYLGTNLKARGVKSWIKEREMPLDLQERLKGKNEFERMDIFTGEAYKSIKEHPFRNLAMIRGKFMSLLFYLRTGTYLPTLKSFIAGFPLYILAFIGFLFSIRYKNKLALLLAVIIGYFVLFHSVIYAVFRFFHPVIPYVMIFASFAGIKILEKTGIDFKKG